MPWQVIPASELISVKSLGAAEFTALMTSFRLTPGQKFALAVSGGPDSMALAYCASRWAREHNFSAIAFIVDHGLRPESSAEAEETRKRLTVLGLQSEILRWDHAPVVTRLHASARKARYGLLTEACRRHSLIHLMLAHQREDQAETILMRLAKGSGIDGLAGMRDQSVMDDVLLLRPLLNIPKERLVATCRAAKIDFIEDASNSSDKFARGRLRKVMPLLAEEGLTLDRLIDLGNRAHDAKEALEYYTQVFLREASDRNAAGVIHMKMEKLQQLPRAIATRALTLALQDVHKADYAPEYASLTQLLQALLAGGEMAPRTLHGCLFSQTPKQITIMREFAAITEAPRIRPGESVVWDRRWHVTLADNVAGNFSIRPLGNPAHDMVDAFAPGLRRLVPQGRARASLPALWDDGEGLVLIPRLHGSGPACARLVSSWPPEY